MAGDEERQKRNTNQNTEQQTNKYGNENS